MSSPIKAAKNLGQHFLRDAAVISAIVETINPQPKDALIEIGPGLGALTLPVLQRCAEMTAYEIDARAVPYLAAAAAPFGRLHIIEQDIMQVNLSALAAQHGQKLRLIGNLPYNLSSAILLHCLAHCSVLRDVHFMLQKEVVERIVALPGGKDYGRLTLALQQSFNTEYCFSVSAKAFDPPPKVESALLYMQPLPTPRWQVGDAALFHELIRVAFGQRRKMLRKSLADYLNEDDFRALAIAPTARPAELSGADYARISCYLHNSASSQE